MPSILRRILRAAALGAFEQHMLNEMGSAAFPSLRMRSQSHPNAYAAGSNIFHVSPMIRIPFCSVS
jgi:hypothetical protein